MPFEHKPGQFTLFKNDKRGNERAPDYKGEGMSIDGTAITVAAWLKTGKHGQFLSCQIQIKEARAEKKAPVRQRTQADLDDDVPF